MSSPLSADDVEILVFTFKDGLLSKVAHDLKLGATALEVERDGERIRASVDASSLRVLSTMRKGRPGRSPLSAKDRAAIERSTRDDVLHAGRYPRVEFEGTISGATCAGTLSLHGQQRRVRLDFRREDGRSVAELELDQRDFGIRPFSAMMGTLKVKPRLRLRISVAAR